MQFTNFTTDDLIDVQGFGRCCVMEVDGSHVQVRGADGFKFWIHRRLVQSVKVGEKTGPAGPATLPKQRFSSYISRQPYSYCGLDRLQYLQVHQKGHQKP